MKAPVNRLVRRPVALVVAGLVCIAAALFFSTVASAAPPPPGNNGTLKIHEQGTPAGTPNTDPKVCVFNVEGFGLDPGQTGYLKFSVQGGDGPTGTPAGPFAFGPANADGFYASEYFNLDPGHYKATLYGKQLPNGSLTDVTAKSKVFKVICAEPEPSPSPSVVPSESPAPSPSPSVAPSESTAPSPSPSVAPSESTRPSPSVAPPGGAGGPSPRVLSGVANPPQVPQVPAGGVSAGGGSTAGALNITLLTLGGGLLLGGATSALLRRRVPRQA